MNNKKDLLKTERLSPLPPLCPLLMTLVDPVTFNSDLLTPQVNSFIDIACPSTQLTLTTNAESKAEFSAYQIWLNKKTHTKLSYENALQIYIIYTSYSSCTDDNISKILFYKKQKILKQDNSICYPETNGCDSVNSFRIVNLTSMFSPAFCRRMFTIITFLIAHLLHSRSMLYILLESNIL